MVNSSGSVWTKSGAQVSLFDLNSFFSVPSGYAFSDPRILFDSLSQRWFASGLSFDLQPCASEEYAAISNSADPTGGWSIYTLSSVANEVLDQPKIGVSSDKVVVSWNTYSGCAHNARVTLEAGFTTVRNVGAGGYADVALRDAINDGLFVERLNTPRRGSEVANRLYRGEPNRRFVVIERIAQRLKDGGVGWIAKRERPKVCPRCHCRSWDQSAAPPRGRPWPKQNNARPPATPADPPRNQSRPCPNCGARPGQWQNLEVPGMWPTQ